jgi:hypothetical protein
VLGGEVGLAAIIVIGDVVNGGYGKKLGATIGAALGRGGDGPVTDEVRARLDDPIAKFAAVAPTGILFGVIYDMTVKPATLGSALAPLLGLVVAGVLSQVLLAVPGTAPAEAPVAEPT